MGILVILRFIRITLRRKCSGNFFFFRWIELVDIFFVYSDLVYERLKENKRSEIFFYKKKRIFL